MTKLLISSSLLALGLATSAAAQSAPNQSTDQATTNVSTVVVTGKLEEELPVVLTNQGARVDVVTAATIKNGDYVDVSQSLQTTVPGLYVSPKNGPFDYVQVSLQGSSTEDVLWLEDGVRLNNRLYGGTTPLDTLPSSMVERIEVLEGPQALFYGTQSIAGAINVITKDFSETPNGAVSVGGDTNDSWHADGFFRDTIDKDHFVIYASSDGSRGFQPFPTADYQSSATDRKRAYNMLTFGVKDAYDFTNDIRLTVSEQHNTGRLDFAEPELVEKAYNDRDEDIATAKLDYTPSDALQVFFKGYFHSWRSHYTEFDNSLTTPGTLNVVENNGPWGFTDSGASALMKYQPIPQLNAFLGYDFQTYSGSDAVLVITKHSESVNAVFGELATTPALLSNFTLAAGFRFNAPSFGQTATVWNVSARWDVTPDVYVKAMVGTAFRLPTAEELFANDPDDERGDPNLRPETSENANVSIGGRVFGASAIHWEAIGFFRNVINLIDYQSFDVTTDQAVFGNVPGTVRVRGGEFILEGDATPELSGSLSYTYSSATEGNSQQIPQVPLSLAKASVDYHPTHQPFGLSASLNYVGDVYDNPAGPLVRYGDYVVVNVAARVFLDQQRRHRIDLAINNLFNKQYATSLTEGVSDATGNAYTVPNLGQPRTFIARYTYSF